MLKDSMLKAYNDQIQREFYSSYLYLAMAAYLEEQNLPGFAHWMKLQAEEEREHGMKIFHHVIERGGRVRLQAIAEPPADYGTMQETFKQVLEHEQKVTASINALYELALKEKDYPSQIFLQWFITEQVEEEKTVEDVLVHLAMLEEKRHPLLILDRRMGKRK